MKKNLVVWINTLHIFTGKSANSDSTTVLKFVIYFYKIYNVLQSAM